MRLGVRSPPPLRRIRLFGPPSRLIASLVQAGLCCKSGQEARHCQEEEERIQLVLADKPSVSSTSVRSSLCDSRCPIVEVGFQLYCYPDSHLHLNRGPCFSSKAPYDLLE